MPTAFITLLGVPEMKSRYLESQRLFKVKPEVLNLRLAGQLDPQCQGYACFPDRDSNLNDSLGNLLGNYFASRYGSFKVFESRSGQGLIYSDRALEIAEMIEHYPQVKPDWSQIDGGYVYQGPMEKEISSVDFTAQDNLELVYQNSQVKIYEILQ